MENHKIINIQQVIAHYKVDNDFLVRLKEFGLLRIIEEENEHFVEEEHLAELERLMRLHYDLQINMEGMDVIINLLSRMREMQRELTMLRNRYV